MDKKTLHVRQLCLAQAQGFIDAAEHLGGGPEWPHVVYHLSLLALEEVGKASMISAGSIRAGREEDSFIDRWVDNHRRKLQWALWSPMMNSRIDPADFEQAREFAERAHALRLASLYVDPKADLTDVPASDLVKAADAERVLGLARARLELEKAHEPTPGAVDELLDWFLDTMNDPDRSRVILSPPFIAKYTELKGDSRAWVSWARGEMNRSDAEMQALAEAELSRPAAPKGESKPRWRANAPIYTPSHSIRPKALARWNERFDLIQLVAFAGKKDRFTLQITLHDNDPLPTLAGRLTTLAKLTVACLNIGTIGYFWFEPPGFEQEMFKSIKDLEHPDTAVNIGMGESFWGDGRAVALADEMIDRAILCMMAFLPMPEAEAEPIFSSYFNGLAFIAKSDVFYNFDALARAQFTQSLLSAIFHFDGQGPLKAQDQAAAQPEIDARLHAAFLEIMPEREDREKLFKTLTNTGDPDETPLANLRTAKQLADLYLTLVSRRTWRRILDVKVESDEPAATAEALTAAAP